MTYFPFTKVRDWSYLYNYNEYPVHERLERFIYLGDDRQIVKRFCRGRENVI